MRSDSQKTGQVPSYPVAGSRCRLNWVRTEDDIRTYSPACKGSPKHGDPALHKGMDSREAKPDLPMFARTWKGSALFITGGSKKKLLGTPSKNNLLTQQAY